MSKSPAAAKRRPRVYRVGRVTTNAREDAVELAKEPGAPVLEVLDDELKTVERWRWTGKGWQQVAEQLDMFSGGES